MSGEGRVHSDDRVAGQRADDWRAALREHARKVWQAAPRLPAADSATLATLSGTLGPRAGEALELVAAFALGRRHLAGGTGAAPDLAGLDIVLAGLAEALAEGAAGAGQRTAPQQIIQSELWQILHKVRESAELSYARELDLVELDRRILFMLQGVGPLVPADIAGAVGVDKAQVSRSVKRLLELRMVEREQIRAPLHLTRKGEALSRRLSRLAELRNRELTFGVSDEELGELLAVIEILLDRAMLLYEQERELAARGEDAPSERRQNDRIVIDRTRIISPLMTLSAYFNRSGALAFKRLTGLSNFEAFVLSEIGIAAPIDWPTLVAALQRDHSQAGRTVRALIERGLVMREGKPGRRHGRFLPSAEGARLHKAIHDAGRERSAFLLAPLSEDRRIRFLATFDKIRRNAVAQLERERAFAELDRD